MLRTTYDRHGDTIAKTNIPDETVEQIAELVFTVNTVAVIIEHDDGTTRRYERTNKVAMRTPDEWCELLGLDVLDPDGWRVPDSMPWGTPITRAEFEQRASISAVRPRPQLFERLHDDIEADDPSRSDERRIDSGDGEHVVTLLDRFKSAAAQARVAPGSRGAQAWYDAFEEAERKSVFARALADVERVCAAAREGGITLAAVACDDCDEPIVYVADTLLGMPLSWMHVCVPDEAHRAVPACSCDRLDTVPNAYCRQHGIEDVVSGAYDANPDVRRHVDAELARGVQ